jgi:phosphoribosylanthranilate isomerase
MQRTRIKICGLTRIDDVQAACAAGVDALGFVFYPNSARCVSAAQAAALIAAMPAFVSAVGLFVNASVEQVLAVTDVAPLALLQFHGDESAEHSAALAAAAGRPYLQAFRVKPDTIGADLLECEQQHRAAGNLFAGLLLDTHVDAYGGAGKVFDWSLIPKELAPRVVLSGGLNAQNAIDAVVRVRPCAVDISSGVEASKGIKDRHQMIAFINAIGAADAIIDKEKTHENLA